MSWAARRMRHEGSGRGLAATQYSAAVGRAAKLPPCFAKIASDSIDARRRFARNAGGTGDAAVQPSSKAKAVTLVKESRKGVEPK